MSVSVLNTDAALSGKTLVTLETNETITGQKTFSRSPNPPFVVTASSANVPNLDADKLDGLDSTAFALVSVNPQICQGRLTLTSGTPVTTADVTGAGTLYWAPYGGNRVALYDGVSVWNVRAFTERSLALTLTSGKPYDIFVYDNAGTPTLESLVWTNDTTRATALTTQDGVLVKTGATTRRYLGTIYSSGANTTEDSLAKRFVWNYYNRVRRALSKPYADSTTWTYTTATFHQANGNAANQVDVVVGVAEAQLELRLIATAASSTGANIDAAIGEDSSAAVLATGLARFDAVATTANVHVPLMTFVSRYPAIGRHFYTMMEWSAASGSTTWYGSGYGAGMVGSIDG